MPEILFPVGRMVAGNLYKPNDKDYQGNPLTIKSGPNAGQPRIEYFFAVAIAKGQEQHWSQTEWGAQIYNIAVAGFPGGETQRQDFAWKITDGDSQVPNRRGVQPCQKEGYPGHWVVSFSSGFESRIYTADGTQQLMEPNAVKNGYYIQVFGTVEPNMNTGNPGIYINHSLVALAGYGEEIHTGPDAAAVGFGGGALPPGASATPLAGGFNPATPGIPGQTGAPAPQQMPAPASSNVPGVPGVPPAAPAGVPPGQAQMPAPAAPAPAAPGMPAPNAGVPGAVPGAAPTGAAPGAYPAAGVPGTYPQQ